MKGLAEPLQAHYVHSAVVGSFHRRTYSLPSRPHLVLVHYLNSLAGIAALDAAGFRPWLPLVWEVRGGGCRLDALIGRCLKAHPDLTPSQLLAQLTPIFASPHLRSPHLPIPQVPPFPQLSPSHCDGAKQERLTKLVRSLRSAPAKLPLPRAPAAQPPLLLILSSPAPPAAAEPPPPRPGPPLNDSGRASVDSTGLFVSIE